MSTIASNRITAAAVLGLILVSGLAVASASGFVGDDAKQCNGQECVVPKTMSTEFDLSASTGANGHLTALYDSYVESENLQSDDDVAWGDLIDFDRSAAIDPGEEGVDYEQTSMSSTDTATLAFHNADMDSAHALDVVVEGDNLHTTFLTDVTVDHEVATGYTDSTPYQTVRLSVDEKTDLNNEITVKNAVLDSDREVIERGTELASNKSSYFTNTQYVRHTVEVDDSKVALGDLSFGSTDATSKTFVKEAKLESVSVDGSDVSALSGITLDGDYDIKSEVLGTSDDATMADDQIVVTLRFELNDNYNEGQTVFDGVTIDDVYDAQVASTGSVTSTAQ